MTITYYGDEPHQIVLFFYHPQQSLIQVACTCSVKLGLVPISAGTEAALALFRPHKESVT